MLNFKIRKKDGILTVPDQGCILPLNSILPVFHRASFSFYIYTHTECCVTMLESVSS